MMIIHNLSLDTYIIIIIIIIKLSYSIDIWSGSGEPRDQGRVVFCYVVGVSVGGFFRLTLYFTTMNGHGQSDT